VWIIENGTSGSQNIIISQGSGANITIPAGDTKVVYSDGAGAGAAFVDAFASLNVVDLKVQDDLTVTDDASIGGDATITGTLGVTGVFTGTTATLVGANTLTLRNDTGTDADEPKLIFDNDTFAGANHANIRTGNGGLQLILESPSTSTFQNRQRIFFNSGGADEITFDLSTDNGSSFTNYFKLDGGNAIFNEDSADVDFRVESDGNTHALFVQGSDGNVGIGTSSPRVRFQVTPASNDGLPSLGTASAGSVFTSSNGLYGLNIGVDPAGLTWMQAMRFDGVATAYDLVLQASGGNVGIGTSSPLAKLHIYDGANATEATAQLKIEGAGYAGFHWLNGTAYYIGQNSNGRQLRMYSGSDVGVGVFLTNGGNSWSSYSDERLKENIADIGSVTEKIKDIRCVTYNRKDVDDENKHETIGFIAQDFIGKFDQVLDESKVLDSDEETRYSIKYTETIPILMKAIQEQQTLIESLTTRLETLENA
jgi:hypothetical protein